MENIYQGGFAWAFNGIWQCPDTYGREKELDRKYGKREVYQFYYRIALFADGNFYGNPEPYSREISGGSTNLYGWSVGEETINNLLMVYLCTGGNSRDYFINTGKNTHV